MVWLMFGVVGVGVLLLIVETEEAAKHGPNGRMTHMPLALRADRVALGLLVLAVDLVAAAAFLAWPLPPEPGVSQGLVAAVLLGLFLAVGPAAWLLIVQLDRVSTPVREG